MASQLTGRLVQLSWPDFSGQPPGGKAKELDGATPGRSVFLAGTFSNFTATFGGGTQPNFDQTPGSSPPAFTLRDDVTIAVTFEKTKSWKVIDHLSDITKDFLLDHEQGHYDITALMARDCFIEVMQVKGKTFPSASEGAKAVLGIVARYRAAWDKVQTKYDWDTNHGTWNVPSFGRPTKGTEQVRWEGYIRRAFTDERTPAVQAPDGAMYKRKLTDVARDGIAARNETCDF